MIGIDEDNCSYLKLFQVVTKNHQMRLKDMHSEPLEFCIYTNKTASCPVGLFELIKKHHLTFPFKVKEDLSCLFLHLAIDLKHYTTQNHGKDWLAKWIPTLCKCFDNTNNWPRCLTRKDYKDEKGQYDHNRDSAIYQSLKCQIIGSI